MLFLLRAWSIQLNNLVFTKYEEVIKAFIPNGIVPQKEIFLNTKKKSSRI